MDKIEKSALPALWKADEGFVELAKHLYGPDVTLAQVERDLFGKMDPTPSDVHAQEPAKVGRKKKPLVIDQRALQTVGKSFISIVEKAKDVGLIDSEGNLNEAEIEKSRNYVRDHGGRFAASGGHAVGHLLAAGALAGTGAVLAAKAPASVKYAAESAKFVGRHLKSSDPVERHVARALLPHVMSAHARALGTAGTGAIAAAGGVYEGNKAYEGIRHMAVKKDWKDFDAKRAAGKHKGATAAGTLAVGAGVSEGIGRAGGKYYGRQAEEKLAESSMWSQVSEGFRQAGKDSYRGPSFKPNPYASQAGHMQAEAHLSARDAKELVKQGKKISRLGRKGALGMGAAAGTVAYGAALHHENKKYKESLKKNHDVTWEGDFSKVDEDKRQVFGWASVAELDGKPVVDLQGDYIHPDDVEKAAYDYVLNARVGGDMHARVDENGNLIEKADKPHHVSDLIESMVFTPEKCEAMGVSKNLAGRWWTGFQVNDPDVWQAVKTGERTGFSIHGSGIRKSVEVDELNVIDELIGKAYEISQNKLELMDNLATLYDVTGEDDFAELAKHLHHGLHQQPQEPVVHNPAHTNAAWGAGIGAAAGSNIGTLAGLASGHEKGAQAGGALGGLVGATAGATAGYLKPNKSRPKRPPSVDAVLGPQRSSVSMRAPIDKAVSTANRMGGAPGARQEMYMQHALQQATDRLAPQVATHIQNMQQQQWQQQMLEQQQMAMMAGQNTQDFAVQVGPYANNQNGNASQSQLAPSQQMPNQQPSGPTMPTMSSQTGNSSGQAL